MTHVFSITFWIHTVPYREEERKLVNRQIEVVANEVCSVMPTQTGVKKCFQPVVHASTSTHLWTGYRPDTIY